MKNKLRLGLACLLGLLAVVLWHGGREGVSSMLGYFVLFGLFMSQGDADSCCLVPTLVAPYRVPDPALMKASLAWEAELLAYELSLMPWRPQLRHVFVAMMFVFLGAWAFSHWWWSQQDEDGGRIIASLRRAPPHDPFPASPPRPKPMRCLCPEVGLLVLDFEVVGSAPPFGLEPRLVLRRVQLSGLVVSACR